MLEREEHVEQAFFFETFLDRLENGFSTQEFLQSVKHELLTTTKLPLAIDFLQTDLKLTGSLASAMSRIPHYFTPFQTFIISETEQENNRFDFRIALQVLQREAKYKAENGNVQGLFFYQFETICRNRLGYDAGLSAIAGDAAYDENWRNWLERLRLQIGWVDFADLIYVRSAFYAIKPGEESVPRLFGEREGRIAFSTRGRDPIYLFAALSRHLGYPSVPRQKKISEAENLIPLLKRRIELLENRLVLLEEELRGGINLNRFIVKE